MQKLLLAPPPHTHPTLGSGLLKDRNGAEKGRQADGLPGSDAVNNY